MNLIATTINLIMCYMSLQSMVVVVVDGGYCDTEVAVAVIGDPIAHNSD